VRIEDTDLTTFPDVTVVCGERRTASNDRHAVVNPTLLVEVTSSSTGAYDRVVRLSTRGAWGVGDHRGARADALGR